MMVMEECCCLMTSYVKNSLLSVWIHTIYEHEISGKSLFNCIGTLSQHIIYCNPLRLYLNVVKFMGTHFPSSDLRMRDHFDNDLKEAYFNEGLNV